MDDELKHKQKRARELWSQLSIQGRMLLDLFVEKEIELDEMLRRASKDDLEEFRRFCNYDKQLLEEHQQRLIDFYLNKHVPQKIAKHEARQKQLTDAGLPRDALADHYMQRTLDLVKAVNAKKN